MKFSTSSTNDTISTPRWWQKPTAVILVDSEILEGEDALSAMRQRWPETPILSEKSLVDEMIDSVDKIDVEDIITALTKKKYVLGNVMQVRPFLNPIFDISSSIQGRNLLS